MGNTYSDGEDVVCRDPICYFQPCGPDARATRFVENVTVVAESKRDQQNWLRAGERRWIPESIYRSRLLCGIDVTQSWVAVNTTCMLYGADGEVIAIVGNGALSRVDGVFLDFVNNVEVLSVCLEMLDDAVKGVVVICTPGLTEHLKKTSALIGSSGPCTVYLASASTVHGDLMSRPISRLTVPAQAREKDAALVLLALHSGLDRGEPWQLEAVGKNFKLPEHQEGAGNGKMLAAALESTVFALASKAKLSAQARPHASLPDTYLGGGAAAAGGHEPMSKSDLVGAFALVDHTSGTDRYNAECAQRRSAKLLDTLASRQDSLRTLCNAVQSVQYNLESWRREAMLNAQQGDAAQLEAMLNKLPHSFPPDALHSKNVDGDLFLEDELSEDVDGFVRTLPGAADSSFPPVAPPPLSPLATYGSPDAKLTSHLRKTIEADALQPYVESVMSKVALFAEGVADASDPIHAAEIRRNPNIPDFPSPDRRRRNSFRDLFAAEAPKLRESKVFALGRRREQPPAPPVEVDWSGLPPPAEESFHHHAMLVPPPS